MSLKGALGFKHLNKIIDDIKTGFKTCLSHHIQNLQTSATPRLSWPKSSRWAASPRWQGRPLAFGPLVHSLVHSFGPLVHALAGSFVWSVGPFIDQFVGPLVHSLVHSFVPLVHSFVRSYILSPLDLRGAAQPEVDGPVTGQTSVVAVRGP